MSDFSVISQVSNEILRLLREKLCPELIQSPESIKLISPGEKNADFQLGMYLYDVQELREQPQTEMVRINGRQARYPSKPLNLFFALYINTKSQMMSDMENELRIMGKLLQIFMDHGVLENFKKEEEGEDAPTITLLNLNFEEKGKWWSMFSMPYQLAVYFSVSPVILSSEKVYTFTRVLETEYQVDYKETEEI